MVPRRCTLVRWAALLGERPFDVSKTRPAKGFMNVPEDEHAFVRRLAQSLYQHTPEVQKLKSHNNRVYALDFGTALPGKVMKLAGAHARAPENVLREQAVLRLLDRMGLAVPHVEFTQDDFPNAPGPFFTMPRMPGGMLEETWKANPEPPWSQTAWQRAGRFVAQLDTVPLDDVANLLWSRKQPLDVWASVRDAFDKQELLRPPFDRILAEVKPPARVGNVQPHRRDGLEVRLAPRPRPPRPRNGRARRVLDIPVGRSGKVRLRSAEAEQRKRSMSERIFGQIPGYAEGSCFASRGQLAVSGVHRPLFAGISGSSVERADSVVLSGGYEDDQDLGSEIIYTGEGSHTQLKYNTNGRTLCVYAAFRLRACSDCSIIPYPYTWTST